MAQLAIEPLSILPDGPNTVIESYPIDFREPNRPVQRRIETDPITGHVTVTERYFQQAQYVPVEAAAAA